MGQVSRYGEPVHILVVEDEFLISEWIAEVLAAKGFAVETAANARDALRHLACGHVDVLFTDINLAGGMDGVALSRCAREMLPDLPIVYASARFAMLEPEARVPGSTFVRKPYEAETVARLLAALTKSQIPVMA